MLRSLKNVFNVLDIDTEYYRYVSFGVTSARSNVFSHFCDIINSKFLIFCVSPCCFFARCE